jgi:hypothetical protein
MDDRERLHLDKMIQANNVVDVTDDIRAKRHSMKIKADVDSMLKMKQDYARLAKTNASAFDSMLVKRCSFLFDNYTDLFNKIKKDELDLTILGHFLAVLREIEEGRMDQHTGAYEVGKVLKRLYIDSAVTKADRLDSKHSKHSKPKKLPAKKISWAEYKAMQGGNKTDN